MANRRDTITLIPGASAAALAPQRAIGGLPNASPPARFGMNLDLWTQTVTPAFFPLLGQLRAIGYEGVEIPVIRGEQQHLSSLRRVLDSEGLACTTLSAVTALADPASSDTSVRRAGLETLRWAVDASQALGSKTLSGPLYAASVPTAGVSGPAPDALRWSAETLAAVCEYAKPAGVRLCLEFLNRFEGYLLNTAEDTMALIRSVAAPNLGVAFDTHHAQIEEHGLAAAIAVCGDRLFHTHISESHRGTLGSGTVEWDQVFAALAAIDYSGWLTVEAFAKDVQPLATAAHVWRNTFDSKDQLARDGLAFLRKHRQG